MTKLCLCQLHNQGKMLLDVFGRRKHVGHHCHCIFGLSMRWAQMIWKISICTQWLMGFLSFWHRGEARTARLRVLPWHVFLGLYTYGLAVATAETGLLEKLTFLQTRRNVSRHCPESMVVNGLGLGLALLSGIVILAAVSPKHQTPLPNKLVYSDAKCLSS